MAVSVPEIVVRGASLICKILRILHWLEDSEGSVQKPAKDEKRSHDTEQILCTCVSTGGGGYFYFLCGADGLVERELYRTTVSLAT